MSIELLHIGLTAFTLFVIIGVVLEGEEIWDELAASGWKNVEHKLAKLGFALLVIGLAGELFFQTRIESADAALKREFNIKIAQINIEAARIRERAAFSEERLLAERRLTANERWRLERLEKALLPRSIGNEQSRILVNELRGKAKSVCVLMLNMPEPRLYAIALMQIFKAAGIEPAGFTLPRSNERTGVSTWVVNDEGEQIADILWRVAQIGGGKIRHAKPIGLETLPDDKNCLIVGENDAALRAGGGQPGEGLDAHGDPVPGPQ